MNKIKLLLVGLIAAAAVAVTGCSEVTSHTKINRDGSGKVVATVKVDAQAAIAGTNGTLQESDLDPKDGK